jgi:hypothetical protein
MPDLEYGDIPMNPTYIQAMQAQMQMEQQKQQQGQAGTPPEGLEDGPGIETEEGGQEEEEDQEDLPQYADSVGKSISLSHGTKILDIDLSDLDEWRS